MASKHTPVINVATLLNGGATGINVRLWQRKSGRCRVFYWSADQEGGIIQTIGTFYESDWQKARKRATALTRDAFFNGR